MEHFHDQKIKIKRRFICLTLDSCYTSFSHVLHILGPYLTYDRDVITRKYQPMYYNASVNSYISLVVKELEQALLDTIGSDATEAACEAACPGVLSAIPGASLAAQFLCHPACLQ